MSEREKFELAYENTHKPIIARPYPKLENGAYQYLEIVQAWELWQAATAQAVPEGHVVVPVEPTYLMIKRAAESVCKEWEGTPTILLDFLDFSGENMAHLVIAEALRQAVKAAQEKNQ